MKLNLGRRIVLFIHWLASLVLLAIIVFPDYVAQGMSLLNWVPANYMQIAMIALLTIYLLLSLSVLCMVFKRDRKGADRGFVTVDSAETGRVRIAMSAIEQMVKQAAYTVDGIADMKIGINNADDAIEIQVNVTMINGSHVPTVTLNMQRAIRQYVEMNCGVAVRSVSISIQSVTSNAEGGKRSKRSEGKVAAPVQPVPEQKPILEQPVEIPVAQPEFFVEREVFSDAAEDAVSDMNSESTAVEEIMPAETDSEAIYIAEEELNTEEEKEN